MFFIFDTETTDLVANSLISEKHQPHIIEFYGCLVNDMGEITDELGFLCDPGVPVTPEITRITGIKPQDVQGQPPFSAFTNQILCLIGKAEAAVAHNLSFDMTVVDAEFNRLGQKVVWPKTKICTVQETEWFKGYRLSLSALHEHLFDEKFEGAHRAKVDVSVLVKCFNELRERGDVL
jgi:DNA polymerase III epsilon subunit-like protein